MAHPEIARAVALSEAGRQTEAVAILDRLATQREPEALAILAEVYWRGGMVARDLPRARDYYRRAGEAGAKVAGIGYTNLLASGIAGPRDWPQAVARLRREAETEQVRRAANLLIGWMTLDASGGPAAPLRSEKLSEAPEVWRFPGLFSDVECDYLRHIAEIAAYQPSTVADSAGRPVLDTIRTSDAASIHWLMEDPATHALNRRLAAATGTAAENAEPLQILRYGAGQQYRPHRDLVRSDTNQRFLTALVYLNDDYEGGETVFVKTGLSVKGRKGDGLVFRNALPDRTPDPLSEHAGAPVTKGVKYLASRWIHEARWAP